MPIFPWGGDEPWYWTEVEMGDNGGDDVDEAVVGHQRPFPLVRHLLVQSSVLYQTFLHSGA